MSMGKAGAESEVSGTKTGVSSSYLSCAHLGPLSSVLCVHVQKMFLKNGSNVSIYDHLQLWDFRCTGARSEPPQGLASVSGGSVRMK